MLAAEETAVVIAAFGSSGVVLVMVGFLTLEMARRCRDGRIGPSRFVGIRTAATRSSPDAWRVAHEAGFPMLRNAAVALAGTGVASVGVAVIVAPFDSDAAAIAGTVATLLGVVAIVGCSITAAVRGHRAAVAHRAAHD